MFSVPSPAPVKLALNHIGFNVGKPRLPLVPPNESEAAKILEEVAKHQIDLKG
jgi:4-hydroxy-tetrahydrodipicolinate synthase